MLNFVSTIADIRSRTGHLQRVASDKAEQTPAHTKSIRRWQVWIGIVLGAIAFLCIGAALSYADPTVGWLDAGTLSLSLFAAWSCLLGYGVAGLLPVMMGKIGKEGGLKPWKPAVQTVGMLIAYLSYIVLLCVLL